jgi:hypothetical protein
MKPLSETQIEFLRVAASPGGKIAPTDNPTAAHLDERGFIEMVSYDAERRAAVWRTTAPGVLALEAEMADAA